MPSYHNSGSDTSRPEMGIMAITHQATEMQKIVENGFHVRMMFLLLALLLSIVNLPIAFGQTEGEPRPQGNPEQPSSAPSAESQDRSPSPVSPPPPFFTSSAPTPTLAPSPTIAPLPSGVSSTNTTSTTIVRDTWNESEKAGVVIASIAAFMQVAVVAFLLIKRHQMLTTVEYDDIDDLEYDNPRDSDFRDIESA